MNGRTCTAPRRPAWNPDEHAQAFASGLWTLDDDAPGLIRRSAGGDQTCERGPKTDPSTPTADPAR